MPFDLSTEIDPAKLTALAAIFRPRVAEVVRVEWGGGAQTRYYGITDWNTATGFSGLAAYGITDIKVRFEKLQFINIPRAADISDDKVDLDFIDFDQAIITLFRNNYGEGSRVTIFEWFPEVDLLTEVFWGHLESPSEMNGYRVKIQASTGFRSPNLSLPHRTMYAGCQALFGGHVRADGSYLFPTLASLADNDCTYDRHLGGSTGTPGFTSCPRNNIGVCTARGMAPFYLAFDFSSGVSIVGNDKKWTATTRGNSSNQNKALRVIAGTKRVRDLDLQAFQSQSGGNNPQAGYLPSLWAVCEGPIVQAYDFYVNGQYIALNHQIVNRGEIGQPKVPYPTSTINYSGTVLARLDAGPKDWRNTTAEQLSAECTVVGQNNVRVYSNPTTYTKQYTTNRAWWLLHVLTNKRWGYGMDYSRIVVQDWIDLAAWCDETVTTTDFDDSPLTSTRSTFNADLNEQTVQEQITRICLGGRFGLPFNYGGKMRCVPLSNVVDSDAPTFTDVGSSPNIVFENGRSTLTWSRESDKKVINQIKVTFDNGATADQSEDKVIIDDLDQQLLAGIAFGDRTKRVISKSVTAFGIIHYGEVVRWARMLLDLGEFDGYEKPGIRNNLRVKFKTWAPLVSALKLYPYKLINVVNPKLQEWEEAPGLPFLSFRVMKLRRLSNQMMEVEAQAYPNNYYGDSETGTYTGSSGTPNPGGRYIARPRSVISRVTGRTLDYITVSTEEE